MVSSTGFWRKPFFNILFALFVIWIVLFEFILPENSILPRPGIVLLSIPALFEDYHLITNFFATLSAIYLPALLAYLVIFIFRNSILNRKAPINYITGFVSKLFIFFPPFLLAVIFVFWFSESFIIEYIFAFIISVFWWLAEVNLKAGSSNENYRTTFKSLGADERFINEHIVWNEIKPEVFNDLSRFHLHLWAVILVFEYVSNTYGLGSILHQTLLFHDLSALFLVIFIICVFIYLGSLFLKSIDNRFVFWSAE
jgi:ABC-type nitrate/sulfonate/bicarbonate transport system permease component